MEMIKSGNPIVDKVAQMHFSGNVIPKSWNNTITYKNGKPNLVAMHILADIVYWYRPNEIRDEDGQYVKYAKKFADKDYLQKSYKQICDELGITVCQAKSAIVMLEKEIGVIKRHFKNVKAGKGVVLPNVMFIELIPEKLKDITFGVDNIGDSEEGVQIETQIPRVINMDTPSYNYTYPQLEMGTNTKNTYKEHNKDYKNQSYLSSDYEIAKAVFKKQIDYDTIRFDGKINMQELDGLIDIVTDVLVSKKKTVRISGEDMPIELVRNRFSKLNMFSIDYVFERIDETTTEIKNPKQYLLASLYNAPVCEDMFWRNQVNVTMRGGDNNVG